jgi:ubiquinone/menaquinone biosynthesis C-methylase UbiE
VGFYERRVLPRIIELTCANRSMERYRRPVVRRTHGTVLELGFGSGPNLPLYPDAVDRVLAVDPSELGRKLAGRRLAATTIPVDFVGLDGESLDLPDASVDSALSTWTLCTIADPVAALREVRRVLKPDGQLHFLEHGLSDDPRVASRQHRYTPVQRRVAGGCHLDRDFDTLVAESGLEVRELRRYAIAGPSAMSFMYDGTAG